jgi:D-3-phosphoglycerate dehydrogenase
MPGTAHPAERQAPCAPPGRRLRLFLAYTQPEFAQAYDAALLARLERSVDVVRNPGPAVLAGPALAEAAAGCELLLAYRSTPVDAASLQALPGLLACLRAAVDVSTIDVAEASRLGILVTQVRPGFQNAVAELGMGMLVDLARGITAHRLGPQGGHGQVPRQGRELRGATLGLIGYGGIARRMAELAQAFGMEVQACDPLVQEADIALRPLDAVLAATDFVVCLAQANAQTHHLVNQRTLAQMQRGAFFVNLARGELVDEDALEQALATGQLGGAALDVGSAADQKPAARFVGRADVVLTQHIGATTAQARAAQTLDSLLQVEALAQGRMPFGAVNPAAAHRFEQWRARAMDP